ncbi:hypothetical protein R1sor_021477 [Riccia sorocarpa]|uniref:Uncharacterized protein n=1 Tax=Riccia sorocarpa TaxID=122646 RepID=A0ABD3GKW7_9MARC
MSASTSESYEEKTMKVMVLRSKSLKRVIYLECGKDFADVLLSLLIMSVGAIMKTIADAGLGLQIKKGLFNLYVSLGTLEDSTLEVEKTTLMDPASSCGSPLLRISSSAGKPCLNVNCPSSTLYDKQLCNSCEAVPRYKCKCHRLYATSDCRHCTHNSTFESTVCLQRNAQGTSGGSTNSSTSASGESCKGFVKDNITFMIQEDLSIIKSSTIRSLSLLQSMKVTNFLDLDTKEIRVGRNEGLLLVKAALVSDRPLTDVFESCFTAGSGDFVLQETS